MALLLMTTTHVADLPLVDIAPVVTTTVTVHQRRVVITITAVNAIDPLHVVVGVPLLTSRILLLVVAIATILTRFRLRVVLTVNMLMGMTVLQEQGRLPEVIAEAMMSLGDTGR